MSNKYNYIQHDSLDNYSADGMTARSIASNYEAYEAARSGFFVLEINGLDNLIQPNAAKASGLVMNEEAVKTILKLNVTSCTVPTYSIEPLKYQRGNDVVKFAGLPTFSDGSITVDDIVGLDTKSILMAWLRLAYDPYTFKGGRMKDYKKSATLYEYTQDYEKIREWDIEGIFITGLTESEFNKESDGKRQITANFVYDYARMKSAVENINNPNPGI